MNRPLKINDYPFLQALTLERVDSTNNYLREHPAPQDRPVTLVTAEFQGAGRGQRGNSWESECGKNLLFSLSVRPQLPVGRLFSLSEACALTIRDTLEEYAEGFEVKWPNDIYYRDNKIAGILIETTLTGKFIDEGILGVGLNLNQQAFLTDAPNPTSLSFVLGEEVDRSEVMNRIIEHFKANYDLLLAGEYEALHARYMNCLYRRKGLFPYADGQGPFRATIQGVEPTGHLLLRDESGRLRRYAFKEVAYVDV